MSDIAAPYLPCRAGIGHLPSIAVVARQWREAMSPHEHQIATPVRSTGARSIRITRAKAVALETIQTLSATARNVLFAYAMTGSAVASLVIIAGPHLEMLMRCIFHGRG
jgi:hypothetical protein